MSAARARSSSSAFAFTQSAMVRAEAIDTTSSMREAISSAVSYLRAGSRSSARNTTASSSGETAGLSELGGGMGLSRMLRTMAPSLSP